MASAGRASVMLQEDHVLAALDGMGELAMLRRAMQSSRAHQQAQAWARYAGQLEMRLQQAYEQLAAVSRRCEVLKIAGNRRDAAPALQDRDATQREPTRLELLARVRAEQLMSVRLLNLLARCTDPCMGRPDDEAAALLDARQRRALRAHDLEESLAEHEALRDAVREQHLRASDGRGAIRLRLPGT